MASGKLVVKQSDGSLLYDTRNITYGLVKSGNLVFIERWKRLRLRGVNVDPNIGSSWVPNGNAGDAQYGFTIEGSISPIVFLVGKGAATGVRVSGNSKTFMFVGGDESTRYYCFDLMRDDSLTGPKLKTWNEQDGAISFNSRQIPLNVVAAIEAPPAGPADRFGRPLIAYVGGWVERIGFQVLGYDATVHCVIDLPLEPGANYAACLPWNRSCGVIDGPAETPTIYGLTEGAYGHLGGISFFWAPEGATTQQPAQPNTHSYPYSFINVPSLTPKALVIKTDGLPFPFN